MTFQERTDRWKERIALVEETYRLMWEGRIALAALAHGMGGLGIGVVIPGGITRRLRSVGYVLIGLSLAFHLYAMLTPRERRLRPGLWESMTESGED